MDSGSCELRRQLVTFTVSNGLFTVSQTVDFKVKLNVLPSADYTKGSYYLYQKEAGRIEAEMAKPGANNAQLAAELDQAESHLFPSLCHSIRLKEMPTIPSGRLTEPLMEPLFTRQERSVRRSI